MCLINVSTGAEPAIEVIPRDEPAHLHETYQLDYVVRWEGPADAYLILPAEIGECGWADVRLVHTTSSRRDGTNTVVQAVEVLPNEVGEHEMPWIVVPYVPDGTALPGADAADEAARTLRAEPVPVRVTAARTANGLIFSAIGGATVLVLALGTGYVVRRRRLDIAAPDAGLSPWDQVQSALHDARRHRLDGQYYKYYRALGCVLAVMGGGGDRGALAEALAKREKETGYQDVRPADDQLTGDMRDVERAVARWKEDLSA